MNHHLIIFLREMALHSFAWFVRFFWPPPILWQMMMFENHENKKFCSRHLVGIEWSQPTSWSTGEWRSASHRPRLSLPPACPFDRDRKWRDRRNKTSRRPDLPDPSSKAREDRFWAFLETWATINHRLTLFGNLQTNPLGILMPK